jgi:phosphoglycerate dehydrogenase-like enzyme
VALNIFAFTRPWLPGHYYTTWSRNLQSIKSFFTARKSGLKPSSFPTFRIRRRSLSPPAWLAKVEVVFTDVPLPDVLVHRLGNLKWVQFTRGSAFELIEPALRDSDVSVSVIPTIDGVQFAEFAMGCVLLLAKQFPHFFHAQLESHWNRTMPLEISGMTVGILGLGTIGSAVARKAKAFDMRVLGVKRIAVPKPEFVDELWTPEHLGDLLAQSDFFVITLSSTPAVFGLLGLEELKLMKKTAYLINLTGGKVIKEEHLVRALKERWTMFEKYVMG